MNRKSKNLLMKTILAITIILTNHLVSQINQIVYSEAPIFEENGIVMSDRFTVAFNENVIPTQVGEKKLTTNRISPTFSEITSIINKLSNKYGEITIIKKAPEAVYGDVVKTNIRTGKPVIIPDMSQLFSIKFPVYVPIDSLINIFENLSIVKYAEQPVQMVDLFTPPDDPLYATAGNRWYLDTLQAEDAWAFTIGDTSVKVAIMETNGVNINHEDLHAKFVGGDTTTGDGSHGRMVAYICAGITNNDTGMAALGWNLSLLTYTTGVGDTILEDGYLFDDLYTAAYAGARVVNMSFGTSTRVSSKNCPYDYDEIHERIITMQEIWDIVFVAAAGNGAVTGCGDDGTIPYATYPAAYPEVIGVSVSKKNEEFPNNFNYSDPTEDSVTVAAPGEALIIPDFPGSDEYSVSAGYATSFSTPLVSALAGLIISMAPSNSNLDGVMVRNIITSTAEEINPENCPGGNGYPVAS